MVLQLTGRAERNLLRVNVGATIGAGPPAVKGTAGSVSAPAAEHQVR